MTYYAVTRERGSNWEPALPMREQERWDDHAAFMDALADDAFVILGGPLGGEERTFLLIVDADTEHEIDSRLANDPWTQMGLLRVAKIEPWEILLRSEQAGHVHRDDAGQETAQHPA